MKKEPIIAVILGSVLGLSVAYFAWIKSTNSVKNNNPINASATQAASQTATPSAQNQFDSFAVTSPADNSVVQNDTVTISGIASKNAYVGIATSDSADIVKTDDNGNFTDDITLSGGLNKINLWEFSKDLSTKNISTTIVYTTQLSDSSTSTSDDVAKKLQEAANKPLALYGVITDIAENGIQFKTEDGQIEQVSVLTDITTYASLVGKAKDIKFTDLAIGDFIVAIGLKNEQNAVEAKRVLVTSEPTNDYVGIIGTIDTLNSKDFIVIGKNDENYSIDATGGKATVTSGDDFKKAKLTVAGKGDQIIIIGQKQDNGDIKASLIHILAN